MTLLIRFIAAIIFIGGAFAAVVDFGRTQPYDWLDLYLVIPAILVFTSERVLRAGLDKTVDTINVVLAWIKSKLTRNNTRDSLEIEDGDEKR